MKRVILTNILTLIGLPLFLLAIAFAGTMEFGVVIVFTVGVLYFILIGYLSRCANCSRSLFMRSPYISAPWAVFRCRQCGHNQRHGM